MKAQDFAVRLFLLAALTPASAGAEEPTSAYTSLDADKGCKHKKSNVVEDYGVWRCPGYESVEVWLSAGDQRMYVSFGPKAEEQVAAKETLPGFNDFYKGAIEWRLQKQADGEVRPFAAIARWNFTRFPIESPRDERKAKGQMLVVTRLGPGGVCHVGYVDANLNPGANDLAREIADKHARDFRCGQDRAMTLGKKQAD